MKKRLALLLLFAVLAGGSILISTAKGTADIPLGEIFAILGGTRDTAHAQILWNIRLPRTIVAALVGINLSLSGAIRTSSASPRARGLRASLSCLFCPGLHCSSRRGHSSAR